MIDIRKAIIVDYDKLEAQEKKVKEAKEAYIGLITFANFFYNFSLDSIRRDNDNDKTYQEVQRNDFLESNEN